MLGSSTPIKTPQHFRGFQIAEYAGRSQPFTVWHGDEVALFTETLEEAKRWADSRLALAWKQEPARKRELLQKQREVKAWREKNARVVVS